jgi:hypothetical protein
MSLSTHGLRRGLRSAAASRLLRAVSFQLFGRRLKLRPKLGNIR